MEATLLVLVFLFMYGWNFVYVWRLFVIWMELCLCMKELCLCMKELCLWMEFCDMNACEIYLYMSYIFAVKIVGFNKKQKKEPICRLFAVCHRRQRAFAVCRGRQRSHVAANCASWELTHLVSLPTMADGKDFAVRGRRQRTCTSPSVADGKEPAI